MVVLLWVLWRGDAPARIQNAGRVVLGVMLVQGVIGYTQFFTHLPPVLVGIHVLGASTVWAAVLWFHHGLSDHRPEPAEGADGGGAGGRRAEREGIVAGGEDGELAEAEPWIDPVEPPLREPV